MNNDIARVDHHPVRLRQTFDTRGCVARLLDPFCQFLGESRHLTGRPSRGDDEIIGQRGFAPKIDGYDLFSLVVVQRGLNELEKLVCGTLRPLARLQRSGPPLSASPELGR